MLNLDQRTLSSMAPFEDNRDKRKKKFASPLLSRHCCINFLSSVDLILHRHDAPLLMRLPTTFCQNTDRIEFIMLCESYTNKTRVLLCKRLFGSGQDLIIRAQSTAIFLCIQPFSAWSRTNEQPGDPSASLLLTSEKAVFCKKFSETPGKVAIVAK